MADDEPSPPPAATTGGAHLSETERSGLSAIEAQMAKLQYLMEREYVNLREAMGDFSKEKEYYEMLKQKINSTMPREDERLKLNVSGTRFEIRESVAIKNPFFKTLLSGTFATRDSDGHFYIDRDPVAVRHIFNFLRDANSINLKHFSVMELEHLRLEAEFYMLPDLAARIDAALATESAALGMTTGTYNTNLRSWAAAFNGIFFELTVKRDCKLHSIAFVAGERRRIPCQAFLKEGGLDGNGQTQRIGEVHQQADKGELVPIQFSAVSLTAGTYTLGLYSSSIAAIACCPKDESKRPTYPTFGLGRTYHTTNQRGDWAKRTGEDEYDFCGEIMLSF
jgi:hypothetical protein